MRVLIVPELYRPTQATANGTLNDAVTWVEQWLRRDESIHVYWLLPPRERAGYDPEYVLADRERVTLVEAEHFMSGHEDELVFTESGYTEDQLLALSAAIYDEYGYVDVVVDQLRRGRVELYKWLLYRTGHRASQPALVSVVANVHDLQLPFKYRETGYRNDFQRRIEISDAIFADGMWFKATVDADGMLEYGGEVFRESVLRAALDDALQTHSPIDFSRFEETYREEPEVFHVAGSIWRKKRTGIVMDIAETLHERFGIRTLVTSMSDIPKEYRDLPWVDARPNASRETFEAALREGDLTVCASEFETLARTWFEQAASGQVLVLRDEPWIYDCVPDDYRLVGTPDELESLAVWVVEHWAEAVEENRRMVEYVERIRDPERCGRRTYDDLARRVRKRQREYEPNAAGERVLGMLAEHDGPVALDDLVERTGELTADGTPLTETKRFSFGELVFALRMAGFADTGNPGTPVFARTGELG